MLGCLPPRYCLAACRPATALLPAVLLLPYSLPAALLLPPPQAPTDVAVACERGEVLNAMLLACAGDGSAVAVQVAGVGWAALG